MSLPSSMFCKYISTFVVLFHLVSPENIACTGTLLIPKYHGMKRFVSGELVT